MDTELILLCKALLEAYMNLVEEIVLEPQEIIVLQRR